MGAGGIEPATFWTGIHFLKHCSHLSFYIPHIIPLQKNNKKNGDSFVKCVCVSVCPRPGGSEHLLMRNITGEDSPAPQIHQTNQLQHIESRKAGREECPHPVE